MKRVLASTIILFYSTLMPGQTAPTRSLLGTVTALRLEARECEIKPDNGEPVRINLSANTIVQKISPGDTNLKNAVAINLSEISTGDRALVTLAANAPDALRVVVISSTDIARRDEIDRQDWNSRGVNGIVASKNGNQIVLRTRTLQGQVQQTVTVFEKTKFRRYVPNSVKFADASPSRFEEISVGDQLRARGQKSPDGANVVAEEVVFGTFLTKAGSVGTVDVAGRQITLNEVGTGKTVIVTLSPDSQIKQMSAPPPTGGVSINQIVETMPPGRIEDIKAGTAVIVSSTKGVQDDHVTAILILANADMLIRMLTTPSGRGGTLVFGAASGPGGIDALGIGP